MFAIGGVKASRPTPDSFALTVRRWPRIAETVFALLFFGFWYHNLLGTESFASVATLIASVQSTVKAQPFLALFLLAPLAFVPRLLENLKMIVTGQSWLIDGSAKSIVHNGVRQAQFDDVAGIQIREVSGQNGSDYRLTLILSSGEKLTIHTGSDESVIMGIADDIADLVGVPVATR
jgi:hypothetical protein